MKSLIFKNLLSVVLIASVMSCGDYDEKSPYPSFEQGVSLRPIPSPWTARPRLSLASPSTSMTLSMFSYNPDELSQVDVYVSYLNNTVPPAASGAGSATYANWVAPVTTAGMLLTISPDPIINVPIIPDSGTAPVTISYSRFDQLIKGVNTTTGATYASIPKVLLKSLTGSQVTSNISFTLAELAAATGTTLPGSVSGVQANQPAFLLTFDVTKTDGGKFSYVNSGPGINSNPATGKVVPHTYNGRTYNLIVNGDEGSPFLPGISIRIAP
jgi:hypothetical protein